MGDRFAVSKENKKILYTDSNILYGHSISQFLPYNEKNFDRIVNLEGLLNIPDDCNIGYFVEVGLFFLKSIKGKPRISHLLLNMKKLFLKKYTTFELKETKNLNTN